MCQSTLTLIVTVENNQKPYLIDTAVPHNKWLNEKIMKRQRNMLN
jgi:hypothetical protein